MPNWCRNEIIVSGDFAERDRMVDEVRDGSAPLSFAKIVPPPVDDPIYQGNPSQHSFVCGCTPEYVGESGKGAWMVNGKPVQKHTDQVEGSFASEAGFGVDRCPEHMAIEISQHPTFWWNWNIYNWGTKWDLGGDTDIVHTDKMTAYAFDTAWSPPEKVVGLLAKKYPTLSFYLRYAECGMMFVGEESWANGELVSESSWQHGEEDEQIEIQHPFYDEDELSEPYKVSKDYYENGVRIWGSADFLAMGG
jgi:Ferredoxin-like domain in Api92-like protein